MTHVSLDRSQVYTDIIILFCIGAHVCKNFRVCAHMCENFRPCAHLCKKFRPGVRLCKNFCPGAHLCETFRPCAHLRENFRPGAHRADFFALERTYAKIFAPVRTYAKISARCASVRALGRTGAKIFCTGAHRCEEKITVSKSDESKSRKCTTQTPTKCTVCDHRRKCNAKPHLRKYKKTSTKMHCKFIVKIALQNHRRECILKFNDKKCAAISLTKCFGILECLEK